MVFDSLCVVDLFLRMWYAVTVTGLFHQLQNTALSTFK